jgi:hypothetical protein
MPVQAPGFNNHTRQKTRRNTSHETRGHEKAIHTDYSLRQDKVGAMAQQLNSAIAKRNKE